MDALQLVLDSYDQSKSSRCCVSSCRCICTRKWKSLKLKYINNQWPSPQVAELPDQIQWENMGVGPTSRLIRTVITIIVATLIILGAFIGIVFFKSLAKVTPDTKFLIPPTCPVGVTKASAWSDHLIQDVSHRQGLMHCYCFSQLKKAKGNVNTVFAIKFEDVKTGDLNHYCKGWFWAYSEAMALKFGAPMVIVIINALVPLIFDLLSKFERHKTKTEETLQTF